jgi:hypothetical protein
LDTTIPPAAPAVPAPPATPPKPDALKIPMSMRKGNRMPDRVDSIATIAEKILGLDRKKKQLAGIHIMGPNQETCFVTPPPHDGLQSMYFGTTHPRYGEDRYRWEMQDSGIEYGYKVEGADDAG